MRMKKRYSPRTIKLFLALIYSPIPALIINSYYSYKFYKENNEYFEVTVGFFLDQIKDLFTDIGWLMYNLLNYPFLLPFPVIYIFIFFKVFLSEKIFIEKYKTIILTLMLVFFYTFNHYFISRWYY